MESLGDRRGPAAAARMRMAFALAGVLFAVAALLAPQAAFAQADYAIDELSTQLDVQTDASVHVIERQVLTFSGQNTGVVWYLHAREDGESVKINTIRVAPVDDGGALLDDWTRLQMVDVNRTKQGANPGDSAIAGLRGADVQPWYSYSISDGMVRSYFPAGRGSYLVEADYTIAHRVRVYRDVAELYWRYANSSLPADAADVTLNITLPVPAGTSFTPGEDVMTWGHGPDGGTFAIGEDGSVVCYIDEVERGNYAETHVIFPASWISNVKAGAPNVYTELHKQAAISEEATWVDTSMRGAIWDNKVRVLFSGIAVALILAGVVAVACFGRTARSRRVLVRLACTLGVVALAENLFFREPLAFALLVGAALVVAATALWLPQAEAELANAEGNAPVEADGDGGDGAEDGVLEDAAPEGDVPEADERRDEVDDQQG